MPSSTYPPVSFFFDVAFLGSFQDQKETQKTGTPKIITLYKQTVETQFQSVTGLSVDMQTESLKEGGENRFEHTLPVGTKYSPLVLKRGLVKDSKMIKWCMDALLNFDIHPMDLIVNLLSVRTEPKNTQKSVVPLMTWKVINAWPKKWSVSEFNAEQNTIAIESLELNYSYFENTEVPIDK
ncbi:phage tail protein [Aetokthonos hydrillicola Thurmond2011]|jgi:phage tail-like protein|uniref:Phage tail protein n=1 Tax=Aetokthonos hydrillicola Thurmond2011 TaxID=2712845 RepID=A0AAP5IDT4_9CYAN|nr:phage tail protein [Aetokthonos hydrillicola]MBO3460115.1 phage tail protein [Aetokthonos hydrillicola CCALA 1050]MBW4590733.1 phage tail protein [Aetokthonos hydrillicola CCALA 1050]MDR9899783.1 phage tail protein [Aetokthonos hydrillicola Thurmond2011]